RGPFPDDRGEVLAVAPDLVVIGPEVVHGIVPTPIEDVGVVVHAARPEAEGLVESVMARGERGVSAAVPLAEESGAIATVPQLRGEGRLRRDAGHVRAVAQGGLDPRLRGVPARQQGTPRERAHGGIGIRPGERAY